MLSESCSYVAFLLRSSILWLTCTRGKIEALMELEEALKTLESQEPFGRGAQPWEVANVIIFLASDLSGYMTGESISVSSQHP